MPSEVQEWLSSIGAGELYSYFVQDGFTSLEAVRHMRQSDIDAIVDRKGYMIILNEEIDNLNYSGNVPAPRAVSFLGAEPETRETLMNRYSSCIPTGNSFSSTLARRSKSRSRHLRGSSALPENSRSSVERYVPNSAYDAYEELIKNTRRARSVAYNARPTALEAAELSLAERKRRRTMDRDFRAQSEIMQGEVEHSDSLNRGKFRDHYTNEFVWVEKNHITDVGVKYDGLSRKVDHKPSHWRCEDEIERGKEFKRMNDECADKIADNRFSIDNSRDWLVNDGGVIDRVHRMSAKTAQTKYDLDSIKRNMENLKAMRTRLLKY